MKRIFIDTNILIDYSKGYENVLRKLLTDTDPDLELCINPIVIAEFFSDRNLKKRNKYQEAKEFIGLFQTLDTTRDIGILAGSYIAEQKAVYIGDSLIAATCVIEQCDLYTSNTKDFSKIPKLKFYP